MKLKEMLKNLRESKGFNKKELADQIGISRTYVSRIENGSVEKPTKNILLKLSYIFDPTGENKLYFKMLKSVNHSTNGWEEEFEQYAKKIEGNYLSDNRFNPKELSSMLYRVNKNDNSIVFLDFPYMNIEWLVNQNDFKLFCGHIPNVFNLNKNSEKHGVPLELTESEQLKLRNFIKDYKEEIIADREAEENKEFGQKIEVDYHEYHLIFDLLNEKINDSAQFVSRLAFINKDREIFNAKEFHEAIEKAVEQQDALKLQRLVRMTTINELKQYLSEQN
ncbi:MULTISPECIES: helix-turn-helix domain-containing protein [unclassified Staphylococcus]|uniref:helix-turn-helix domain-containing protein n=1 Tax=unclassified Staphylococcus TaxID=91994 RepID=UPI001AEC2A81|nr:MULTISPECIES: helix-turn-helix domain-containing protein [unclassified Staphylococcus]